MRVIRRIFDALALRRLTLRAGQAMELAFDPLLTVYPIERTIEQGGGERVVVLTPHADDETFGAGGAIARHVDAGDDVAVLLCSDNAASVDGRHDRESITRMRYAEFRRAMDALGVTCCESLDLDDSAFQSPRNEAVETFIIGKNPTLLYLPSLLDNHTHHRVVNKWAAPVIERMRGTKLRVRGYEVWTPCTATIVIDISDVFDRKQAAIDAYASQCGVLPYRQAVEGLNAYRALTLEGRSRQAEAFLEVPAEQYLRFTRRLL